MKGGLQDSRSVSEDGGDDPFVELTNAATERFTVKQAVLDEFVTACGMDDVCLFGRRHWVPSVPSTHPVRAFVRRWQRRGRTGDASLVVRKSWG